MSSPSDIVASLHIFSHALAALTLPAQQQQLIDHQIQMVGQEILQQTSPAFDHLKDMAPTVKQLIDMQTEQKVVHKIGSAFDQLLLSSLSTNDPYRLAVALGALERNPTLFLAEIAEYQLTQEQCFEVAKRALAKDPAHFSLHIDKYALTQDQRFALAVDEQGTHFENFLSHLAAYQLSSAQQMDLARKTVTGSLEKFIQALPYYNQLDVKQCISLTGQRLFITGNNKLPSTYQQIQTGFKLNAQDRFTLQLAVLPSVIGKVKPADLPAYLQAIGFYDQTPAQRWQLVQAFQKDAFTYFTKNMAAYDLPEAQRFELFHSLQTQRPLQAILPHLKAYHLPATRRFELAQLAQQGNPAALLAELQAYELSDAHRLQLAKSLANTNSQALLTHFLAYDLTPLQGFELALEAAVHSAIDLKPFIEAYHLSPQQCAQLTACAAQRRWQAASAVVNSPAFTPQQRFEYAKTALLRHTEGTFAQLVQSYDLTPTQRFDLAKLAILHEDLATFTSRLPEYAFTPEQHFTLMQIAHAHLGIQTLAPHMKGYACTEEQRLQLVQTALHTRLTKLPEDKDSLSNDLKNFSNYLPAYDLPNHHWMLAQLILHQNAKACLASLAAYKLTAEQQFTLLKQAAAINAAAVIDHLDNYKLTTAQAFALAKIATAEEPEIALKFIEKYSFKHTQRLELAQIAVLNTGYGFTNELRDYRLTATEEADLTQTAHIIEEIHDDRTYKYPGLVDQLEAAPTLQQRLAILEAMPTLTWIDAYQLLHSCPSTSGLAILEHLKKQPVIFPPRQIMQLLSSHYSDYSSKLPGSYYYRQLPADAAKHEEFLLALTDFAIQQGANINASNGRGIGSSERSIYSLVFCISLSTLEQLVAKGIEFHHTSYDSLEKREVNLAKEFTKQFYLRDFLAVDFSAKASFMLPRQCRVDPLFRQTAAKFHNRQILDILDGTALTEQDKVELWKLAFQRENTAFLQALKDKIDLPTTTAEQMQVWTEALKVGSPAILEWLKQNMPPLTAVQIDDLFQQALAIGSIDTALRLGQWSGNATTDVFERIATWVIAKSTPPGADVATWPDASTQSIVETLDWLALSSSLTTAITPLSRLIGKRASTPASATRLQAADAQRAQWAAMISRYRSTVYHRRQMTVYNISAKNYTQQQREFGQEASDLKQREIELLRKDPTRNVRTIFNHSAQWRYEIAARRNDDKKESYRKFRDPSINDDIACTPIENKELHKNMPYELTLPLFEKNYRAAQEQPMPGINLLPEALGYQISYTPPHAKQAIAMTEITSFNGTLVWWHTNSAVLGELWQKLEATHTDIVNYPLDKNNPASVTGLEKLVLKGVALSSHIMITDRGNGQHTREILNIWCGYKGLPQLVPSLDYPMLDTIALMLTVEQFSEMPFAAFFEPLVTA